MLQKLFAIWYPHYLKTDCSHEPYLRFIIGLCYLGIVVETIYFFFNLWKQLPLLPTNVSLMGFFALLALVRFSKSYGVVAHVFLGLFCATIVGLATYYQSFPYTILLWGPVFAIMSVYLVGGRKGAVWTLILALLIAASILGANEALDFGYKIQAEQMRSIAAISVVLTMGSALYASLLFSTYISKLNNQLAEKNEILLAQKKQVEDNIEEKKLLISIVCHDIANPLNVINFAVSMAATKPDHDLRGYLKMVEKSSDTITNIIREVRSLQAVDSGKISIELAPINLVKVFDDLQSLFVDRLQEKNLQLVFDYRCEEDLWVEAEEHSLTNNVLSNLVSNAIKFSEPGQTIVLQGSAHDGKVNLLIKDFGIGMPEALVKNLFKQNIATSRPGTKGEKGTGFGMPITKAFMDKYGGAIAVTSVEKNPGATEHGTTFTLSFTQHQFKLST